MEEEREARLRALYTRIGVGIAVAGAVTGIIVFSIHRIIATQSLQPTVTIAVLLNAAMGAGFFVKKRRVLGGICMAGAVFCLFYLKNVLIAAGTG